MQTVKETIRLNNGTTVQRMIRDLHFMWLCDGYEYAHIIHNGVECEVRRPVNSNRVWELSTPTDYERLSCSM